MILGLGVSPHERREFILLLGSVAAEELAKGVNLTTFAKGPIADQGKAIVMISSELPEILRMSDRIVVMCEGRITGELPAQDASQERIMQLATQRETAEAA